MQKNELKQSEQKSPKKNDAKVFSGQRLKEDKSHYSVTIGLPPDEVFAFYRDFENLPRFMKDLKEIRVLDNKRSHWVVQIKGDLTAQWDAEIISERKNEMIAWKSVEGSEVETSGAIFFYRAPADLGTTVSLSLDYAIPGGKLAELITMVTGDNPSELAFINLRRLKAYLETGEIPTTEGQPSGRDADAQTLN